VIKHFNWAFHALGFYQTTTDCVLGNSVSKAIISMHTALGSVTQYSLL